MRLLLAWAAVAAVVAVVLRAPGEGGGVTADGPWARPLRRLRRDGAVRVAVALLAAVAACAVLAPWLTPYAADRQLDIVALASRPPSAAHPLGTDAYSRDVLSRVLEGSRVSLAVALLAALVSATIGTAWGAVAGASGERWDAALMRAVDAMLSVPRVLLLIAVAAAWPSLPVPALILLIGATAWFGVARVVRDQVRALRSRDFVSAANALGATPAQVVMRHVLPNAASAILVAATLSVGQLVLLEAGLSYLGIGVQPPQASWGSIVHDGADVVASAWWVSLFPGLAIAATATAFNVVGDGLRDALDPRELDG